MTCNNVILAQPQAEGSVSYTIPEGDSARLNFGPEDISGLRLGNNGQLIISFEDGGELTITNFQELVDGDSLLFLADGTLVDPTILTGSLQTPDALNAVEAAAGEEAIIISQPTENTTQEIALTEGQKYLCDFDPNNSAVVEIKDGQMVLTFADGSQVILSNYAEMMAGELPPELTLADGTVIDGEALLTEVTDIENLEEIAENASEESGEDVANIEPAAGDEEAVEEVSEEDMAALAEQLADVQPAAGDAASGVSNSGYGFNSMPSSDPLNSPDALGPLNPTALNYNAPQGGEDNAPLIDDRPVISSALESLDETGLSGGNLVRTGSLSVDYGRDGPGAITTTGSASVGGSLSGGILSSGGVPVIIISTPTGYEGSALGVTIFTFEITPGGSYTYTQIESFDHADATDHNDVVIINFGIVATDADGDRTPTTVRVQVADDAPVVLSQIDQTVDETNFSGGQITVNGQFHADLGQDVVSNEYSTNGNFVATGSVDNGVLSSNGVVVVVTSVGNVYTGTAGGVTVFTLTLDTETGEYTYQQFKPLDHGDPNDVNDQLTLQFGVDITDFDGDSADGFITVHVLDDAPEIFDASETINEDNLEFGSIVETGSVDPDFNADGSGAITTTGNFAVTGSVDNGTLSHNGVAIAVTSTPSGYIGVAGALTVFTLDIDPLTGEYTFTQFESLDHADNNDANDVITLTFGAEITDFDGDTDTSNIVINIVDSAPEFQPGGPQPDSGLETVDETDFSAGPLVETGSLDADFGADGPGSYEGISSQVPTGLVHCGFPVTVTFDAGTNTFTGAANGSAVFTLVIDSATGDYTYTQFEALDHPDGSDADDVLTLEFGVNALDGEGEAAEGSIVINVHDDGPDASNDALSLTRHQTTGAGNILTNDDFGADGAADQSIVSIDWNGGDVFAAGVPLPDGSISVQGSYGTLVVSPDGSYTYTRSGRAGGTERFDYAIRDCDGDVDRATLNIDVAADHDPINITGSGATDDSALVSGPDVETGTINVNTQGDGFGATTGNGNFSSGGSLLGGNLTHNGTAVNVSFNAGSDTYTGTAGGLTVFTMVINSNGTYTFSQLETLDHGNINSNNEALTLRFGVDATDVDGDSGSGTVTITVRDDGPTARNDSASSAGRTSSTNVLVNDSAGADGGGDQVISFVYNGQTYNMASGTQTINLGNGSSFTIDDDGDASFTARNNTSSGSGNQSTTTSATDSITLTYTIRDSEGDVSTAQATLSGRYTQTTRWQDWGGDGDGDGGGGGSPLVLDLDGDGVEMTSIQDGVRFDLGSDGDQDLTAWVQADDGLLARDVNQDGEINDQSELFGTLETDGFHVLAEHDSNNDGVIDADDDVFDELLVWQDHNQDGVSQEGELRTLSDLGIQSINLAATMSDYDLEGSWVAYESSFTYEDGSVGQISDVWFQYIDEGNWDRVVEAMGEEAAAEWLQSTHSTVTQFIPSEVNDDWQVGDPLVLGSTHKVFEVGLNDSIVSQDGELTVFYGDDEAGDIQGNGSFQVGGSLLNGALTSHGADVHVTYDAETGIYYGSTADTTVFNLQVNADGTYTFNLFESVDHGNNVNLDDNILLQFGVVVTDADGDTTESAIRLQIRDAGSYLSGDVDGDTDVDSFDSTLFQAIEESAGVLADLSSDSVEDLSLLLETTDEVSSSIQDFVYDQESGDALHEISIDAAIVEDTPLAETASNLQDIVIDTDIVL